MLIRSFACIRSSVFAKENAKGFEGKSVYMNGAEYPVYPFRNKAATQHREFEKIAFSQETGNLADVNFLVKQYRETRFENVFVQEIYLET